MIKYFGFSLQPFVRRRAGPCLLAGLELIALFTPIYQTLPLSQIDVIDEDKGAEVLAG